MRKIPFWLIELAGIALILLLASTIHAQALPDAPTPHILSANHIAIAYDATARILDVVSTNQFLGRGGHEVIMPPTIVNHPALDLAMEASVITVEQLGAHILRKHGYPRLARMVAAIDGSCVMATAIHNFEIQRAATAANVGAPVVTSVPALNQGEPIAILHPHHR